jgi:hypothetical protein
MWVDYKRAAMACVVLGMFGCATTGVSSQSTAGGGATFGAVPLPAQAQVRTLATRAPTIVARETVVDDVIEWRLAGPLPASATVANASAPWSSEPLEALVQSVAPSGTSTSEGVRCLAKEAARHALAHAGGLSPMLARYVAAACGLARQRSVRFWSVALPSATAAVTELSAVTAMRDNLRDQLRPILASARGAVGVAMARDGAQVRVALVSGEDGVRFEPITVDPGGTAIVRGEAIGASAQDRISVLVNLRQGGVRFCEAEPGVFAPRFAVRCPAPVDGAPEYVSVTRVPPGRMLSLGVGTALVGGAPEGALVWRRSAAAEVRFTDVERTNAALEAMVNERRRSIGLAPLTFSTAARRATCPLAPYTVGAMLGQSSVSDGELAVLGMMAGWDVPGRVREGNAGANSLSTRDGATLIAETLDLPLGRVSLLAPEASQASLCPVVVDGKFVGLAYASWATVDEANRRDTTALWTRIAEERRRAGAPALQRWEGAPNALSRALDSVDRGEAEPEAAMNVLTEAAVAEGNTSVRAMAFSLFTPSGAPLQVPAGLLDASITHAQIGATWYRAPGSAWAVRVVYVIVPALSSTPMSY